MSARRAAAPGDLAGDHLPHTAPFLLLDRIVALEGARGRFLKGLAAGDPLLSRAGELSPVLVVEAMAQGGGIVLVHLHPELRGASAMLAAIDHCDIVAPVRAGDILEVEVTLVRRYAAMARVRGRALVGTRPCVTAALTLAFAPAADRDSRGA